jgi:hypothetical protein
MIVIASREEKELLERLRRLATKDTAGVLTEEIVGLRRQISDLEISKSKIEEGHAKERRELTHMIGLEKKRQEFEITQAKAETTLKVQQENLAADKTRFAGEMSFQRERFEKEVGYLKDMMKDILDRLPNVNATLDLGGKRKRA